MRSETSPSPAKEEAGVTLTEEGDALDRLQQRLELPARFGRYFLAGLGAVTVGAALGLELARPRVTWLAFLALGSLLLGLAFVQHVLLTRDRAHRPVQVQLWDEGVELLLANGDLRVAAWSDPKFAIDVFVRPNRDGSPREILLQWTMDRRVPLSPLTPQGYDHLRAAAVAHGFQCLEYSAQEHRRAMRGTEIRPPAEDRPSAEVTRPAW